MEKLTLPALPYDLKALEPIISEKQLSLHYLKHHQAYVDGANAALEEIASAHKVGVAAEMRYLPEELVFNVAGNILHSLYWHSMAPEGEGGELQGSLAEVLYRDFDDLKTFRDEFSRTAVSLQGSGWVALTYDPVLAQLLITKIQIHQNGLYPMLPLVLVLDVWEHAYYLDYENRRKEYVQNWWRLVNWGELEERFEKIKNQLAS